MSLSLQTCLALANDLCKLREAPAEKKIRIVGVPGWFFKVHPDGKYLSFIGGKQNQLLDLQTGKPHKLSGEIDPVWSPDGKFMTHPARYSIKQETGIQIFDATDILTKTLAGKSEDAKSVSSPLGGVYQSIGKEGDSYRMISDQDGVSMTSFRRGDSGSFEMGEVKRPCANFNFNDVDLPMISKDGRFISIHHVEQKRTKIYRLISDGTNCDVALDLGYSTGKVSFNMDSSQIAFHVEQFSDFQTGYFSGVGKDKVLNVIVMKISETNDGKIVPTAWAMGSQHTKPGDGGYYPDFDRFGNVYFMEDIGNNFQFVKVNNKTLDFRPMEKDLVFAKKDCVNCESDKEKSASAPRLLADIWKNICGNDQMLSSELALAIDPKQCRNMVNKFYLKSMTVSKEALLWACPKPKSVIPKIVGKWDRNQKANAEQILTARCLGCHATARDYESEEYVEVETMPGKWETESVKIKKVLPPLKLDKLTADQIDLMSVAINNNVMPKGDPLPEAQKELLNEYFKKRLLDLDPPEEGPMLVVRNYSEEHLIPLRENAYAQTPGISDEQKKILALTINCTYGRLDCDEYIKFQQGTLELASKEMPERQRLEFIQAGLKKARCLNPAPEFYQECYDYQAKNPPKN